MKHVRAVFAALVLMLGLPVAAIATNITPAAASSQYVQSSWTDSSGSSSFSTLFSSSVTVHDTLLAFAAWKGTSSAPTVSDNHSNTWSQVSTTSQWEPNGPSYEAVFIASNVAAGTTWITTDWSGTTVDAQVVTFEAQGTNSAVSSGNSLTAPSSTTIQASQCDNGGAHTTFAVFLSHSQGMNGSPSGLTTVQTDTSFAPTGELLFGYHRFTSGDCSSNFPVSLNAADYGFARTVTLRD